MVRLSNQQVKELIKNKAIREKLPRPVVAYVRPTVSNLDPLKKILLDEDVYVIGSGLSAYDLKWDWFSDKKTICINNTIKWFRNPTLHLFLDMPVLQEGGRVHGVPIVTKMGNQVDPRFGDVYHIKVGHRGRINSEPEKAGFFSSYSSTQVGIHLAQYLGAKRIFLIGVDQKFMNYDECLDLEKFFEISPMHGNGLPKLSEQYLKLKKNNQGFGHWYSPWFAHKRDKFESSYVKAGDMMTPLYQFQNIYQLSPIHNTGFPSFNIEDL